MCLVSAPRLARGRARVNTQASRLHPDGFPTGSTSPTDLPSWRFLPHSGIRSPNSFWAVTPWAHPESADLRGCVHQGAPAGRPRQPFLLSFRGTVRPRMPWAAWDRSSMPINRPTGGAYLVGSEGLTCHPGLFHARQWGGRAD